MKVLIFNLFQVIFLLSASKESIFNKNGRKLIQKCFELFMGYDKKKIPVYFSEEGYDKYASEYDKALGFLDSFEQGYFQWLNQDLKGKKLLDAGCGSGRNTIRLFRLGADITAVDISEGMLKVLKRKKPQIKTVQADVRDLPFDEKSFDIVVSNLVLVHLKYPEEGIDEFYRVLKDGGELFLTVIHQKKEALLKAKKEDFRIKGFYHNAEKVRGLLEGHAFSVLEEREIIENEVKISTVFHCRK